MPPRLSSCLLPVVSTATPRGEVSAPDDFVEPRPQPHPLQVEAGPSTSADLPRTQAMPQAPGVAQRLRDAVAGCIKGSVHAGQVETYARGYGVKETTRSLHPGRMTSQSAVPRRALTVRQEGEVAPPPPRVLRQAASAAQRNQVERAGSGELLANVATLATWRNVVSTRFHGTPALRETLDAALVDVQGRYGLSHGDVTVLAKSLALAFPSAPHAISALNGLTQIRFLDDIQAMQQEPSEDVQRGWQLAARMEGIKGQGLPLLAKLTRPLDPPEAAPIGPSAQGLVRAYLRAAQEVARAHGTGARVDPGHIYATGQLRAAIDTARHGGNLQAWPGRDGAPTPPGVPLSLAEKALLALPDKANPAVQTKHGCEFAIHMVRGGMLTMATRDERGRLTEYALTESRAKKGFGGHLDRALRGGPQGLLGALRQFGLHKDKSPFFAFDRVVSDAGMGSGFGLSHQNAIHDGRAVRDMIETLAQAMRTRGGPGGQPLVGAYGTTAASDIANDALVQVTRLTILEAAQADTVLLPRFGRGDPLSELQRDQVIERIATRLRAAPGAAGDALRTRIAETVDAQNGGLTPQRLLSWAADVGGPGDEAAALAPGDDADEGWKTFSKGYARATGQADIDLPVPPLKGSTRQEASERLADMIRGEELGSGFVLSDAGATILSSGGMSTLVSGILSKATLSLVLDVTAGAKRQVNFQSGVSTDRSFLRVGVSHTVLGHAGVGTGVGVGVTTSGPARIGLGVSTDLKFGGSTLVEEGTVFGFPRHLSGGVGGDRALSALKAQLVELLVNVAGGGQGVHGLSRPGNPEDQDSLVAAAYQAFGDSISVGRFKSTHTTGHGQWRGSSAMGINVGPAVLGVPAARLVMRNQGDKSTYEDLSGTLKVFKESRGHTFKTSGVTVGAGVTTLASQPTEMGDMAGVNLLGLAAAVTRENDFYADGVTDGVVRIFQDDQQLPTSFATKTYANARAFSTDLSRELDQFAQEKSKKYFGARHAADPDASVEQEKQVLLDFAAALEDERDLTATPQLYYEWPADHVEATNLLAADADLSRRLGDGDRAHRIEQRIETMHQLPSLREGRFAISANVSKASESLGSNNIGGFTHTRTTSARESSLRFT